MSNALASLRKSLPTLLALALSTIAVVGCAIHHRVAFETPPYTTKATRQNASVVAVINESTLQQTAPIRISVNGYDNVWEVQPGDMLKQIADIELPQMFSNYAFATNEIPPAGNQPGIVLALTVPSYIFADSQATVTVKAVGRARNGKVLFEKTYTGQGPGQLARQVVFSPEEMEATIRESSLSAYKEAFGLLRADLERALTSNQVVAR